MEINNISRRIWALGGITEHLGGVQASLDLINAYHITANARIVDLGCGTGYTLYLLSKSQPDRLFGLDINSSSLYSARNRISKQKCDFIISLIQTDAHNIPLDRHIVDFAIAESVLVFCTPCIVLEEIRRILKPEGILGDNEITYLKPPTTQLTNLLEDVLGVHAHSQNEWENIYTNAGFKVLYSNTRK